MKLRITALLAMLAAVVAIIAYVGDWGGKGVDKAGSAPSANREGVMPPPITPPEPGVGKTGVIRPVQSTDSSTAIPPANPSPGTQPPNATAPVRQPRGATGTTAPVPAPRLRTSPGDPLAADADRRAASIDADKVSLMLRDYRSQMGENPVGTNAEIMKAVMGGNSKGAMLGPPEGQSLNGKGELVDRWGTPYFFHQLSRSSTEIRSAGPDRVMGTEDDVVVR